MEKKRYIKPESEVSVIKTNLLCGSSDHVKGNGHDNGWHNGPGHNNGNHKGHRVYEWENEY